MLHIVHVTLVASYHSLPYLLEIRSVSEPTFRPVITNLDDLVSHNSGVTHVCTWSRLSLCRGERKVSATSLENHQFPLPSSFWTTLICVGAHTELHLNTGEFKVAKARENVI